MKRLKPRERTRWGSLLPLLGAVALGGPAGWWAARALGQHDGDSLRQGGPSGGPSPTGAVDSVQELAELARDGSALAASKLVARYLSFANDEGSSATRERILDALFDIENLPHRLQFVLDAVGSDPTSPEDDPLWDHAIRRMARVWIDSPARLSQGRDLMLLEDRPRARRFQATSLSRAATELAGGLRENERHAFASDLIDVYFENESTDYRAELERGVAALSGSDAATVLSKGIGRVSLAELGIVKRDNAALEQALENLANGRDLSTDTRAVR